jgi:hypothetical protein
VPKNIKGLKMEGIYGAFGLAASAGLNAYIPLLVVAIMAKINVLSLSSPWDVLSNWWIIGVLVILSIIEFFADKVPALNHANDAIQTFVRPAAGAIVFAASANVINDINPILSLGAGLLVAGGVHTIKSGAIRPAITATTAGVANPFVSILEDVLATILSITAILLPVFLGTLMVLLAALVILFFWRREKKKRLV